LEPEGTVEKVRLEDRLQNQQHGHLHDAIANRGNSQRSQSPVRFGDVHTLDRLRTVSLGAQLHFKDTEKLRYVEDVLEVVKRDTIDAGRSVVLGDYAPGRPQHVGPIDPVVQSVEPESRLLLGLIGQLPPQFRDFRGKLRSRLHLRFDRRWVGLALFPLFRSGTRVQAGLLTLSEA
jgi:hypothetical protein